MTNQPGIRIECRRPAELWTPPTGEEVREVLRLAGLSGSKAAKVLGLGAKGDRTVRRWVGEDSPIPYAAWALLCELAGLGLIWRESLLPNASEMWKVTTKLDYRYTTELIEEKKQ